MAREDTFKALDQDFADKLDNVSLKPKQVKKESLTDLPIKQDDQSVELEIDTLPTKKSVPKSKRNPKISTPIKRVNKTFVIDEDLVSALENVVRDDRTKKKIPGMRGILGKIVSNAIIKELIELGEIEESDWKKRIQEY